MSQGERFRIIRPVIPPTIVVPPDSAVQSISGKVFWMAEDFISVTPGFPMACNLPVSRTIMEKKHVLIVGDDDLISWAIRKRFSAMQIPVRIVGTPGEALAALREGTFGLVVFDPGLLQGEHPENPEELQRISSAARFPHVLERENAGIRNGELSAGIRMVEKPLTIFDLDRVVEEIVGRFSEKRGNPRYTCNIPLSIFIQEEEQDGRSSEWGHPTGVAAEASEDGLRVFASHSLVPGQRLQLVPLAVHNPQARFVRRDRIAEVVWTVHDEDGVIAGLRYLD